MVVDKREQRRINARKHIEYIETRFQQQVQYSIAHTAIFTDTVECKKLNQVYHTDIKLVEKDTVKALLENTSLDDGNIAVLNFASYKNPGGGFINGSIAQEECLCHDSSLYNVLKEQNNYYEWNKEHLNHSLYQNRALYLPAICFMNKDNENVRYANVITCAAPNINAARKHQITNKENLTVLKSRIKFILDIALKMKNQTLILGAYGCGVFGQDPNEVASIFMQYLQNEYQGQFKKVIFAILKRAPKDNYNYHAFQKRLMER